MVSCIEIYGDLRLLKGGTVDLGIGFSHDIPDSHRANLVLALRRLADRVEARLPDSEIDGIDHVKPEVK